MNKRIFAVLVIALVVASAAIPISLAGRAPTKPECNDKIDNDGDGAIDMADAGCVNVKDNDESNCGDAVCEGVETCANCIADCGPCPTTTTTTTTVPTTTTTVTTTTLPPTTTTTTMPNSCTDTDHGFVEVIQGTVSGYQNGEPYSYTDFCFDMVRLNEYYCIGSISAPANSSVVCNATCSNGACSMP